MRGRASTPRRGRPTAELRPPALSSAAAAATPWTPLQGQYLAAIYAYTTLHGRPPAERDLECFFGTTPPAVHRMVVELERRGLITRQPGVARSIELHVPPEALPVLRRP